MTLIASPAQIRAGRALLGWSLSELAERAGISRPTLTKIEKDFDDSTSKSRRIVQRVLEEQGVEFLASTEARTDGVCILKGRQQSASDER
ncbi:MAG TPA: helix-turn-helix domain-containing protein [Ensifer sp.]|nr:helix-turn-helix domain-containing protein [Ensifer sp.]